MDHTPTRLTIVWFVLYGLLSGTLPEVDRCVHSNSSYAITSPVAFSIKHCTHMGLSGGPQTVHRFRALVPVHLQIAILLEQSCAFATCTCQNGGHVSGHFLF